MPPSNHEDHKGMGIGEQGGIALQQIRRKSKLRSNLKTHCPNN